MLKILLTGASGFIGKNIAEYYLKKGIDFQAPCHEELDLLNEGSVKVFLQKHNFDVVIHTANTNDIVHPERKVDMLKTNLQMFYNLANCSNLYGRMYYLGSGAEYDMLNYQPKMKEEYLGEHIPKDDYGLSKYIMARYTEQCDNIYELVLFGVYGKYEEYSRRFISNNICNNLYSNKMLIHKNMLFDYLYIDDMVRILDYYVNNPPKNHRINVCRGEVLSLEEIAKVINKVMNTNSPIMIEEDGWKPEYSGNNELMLQDLSDFRFTSIEEGITSLTEFYNNNFKEYQKDFGE